MRYEIDGNHVVVSKGSNDDEHGADLLTDDIFAPIIDAALADKRPSLSVTEIRVALKARIDGSRSVDAA